MLGGIRVISWTLVLVITPLLVVASASFARQIAGVLLACAVVLDLASASALVLARYRHLAGASLVLGGSAWLISTWIISTTGGLHSAAMVGLFVVAALAGAARGWKWGTAASAAGVGAVLLMAWGNAQGLVQSTLPQTDFVAAAVYLVSFVALGILQSVLSVSLQSMRERTGREVMRRRAAEQRLHDVVDNAPFGAFVAETTSAGALEIRHANHAASQVLGTDATEFVGRSVGEAFWCLQDDSLVPQFARIAEEGGTLLAETAPFRIAGRNGVFELHAFQIAEGSMAVLFSDITEKHHSEAQIHRMAFHDELTRLPNRKLLLDRLDIALATARRRKTGVALLFLDLDDFKRINDSRGHRFGDELLIAVAERLASRARASDTVARLGGDEFTMLITDVEDHVHLHAVARKFLSAFETPFEVDSHTVSVTASIGLSMANGDSSDATTLLHEADIAMYEVKRNGRNNYSIHR